MNVRHLVVYFCSGGKMTQCLKAWFWFTGPASPFVYFSQTGQEQSFLLVPRMRGLGLCEWMRKFITEGVVNHPNLGINFVTCFVRPRAASCHSICSWINIHHLEKSVSHSMIPNMRGSVTEYENCFYEGRCLRLINRPWLVAGLSKQYAWQIFEMLK